MKYALMTLVLASYLLANQYTGVPSSRSFQIVTHDTNNVELYISNFGKFAQDERGGPGCFWPKGSGNTYIFGAGAWFGTIDSLTTDTLVSVGYGPHGGESEFVPGLKTQDPGSPVAIIYMHPENWPPPADSYPMAPQDIVSHEDSWCCYNDCDSNYHIPGDTRPIGIEVFQTGYAWDISEIEDVVFLMYEFKNVTEHVLHDCYIGVVVDGDIGAPGDDRTAGIVGKWYEINSDSLWVDNIGYTWDETGAGVCGLDLLQTPFDLEEGQDKDSDGIPDQFERDSTYYVNNLPSEMWDVDLDNVPDWRDPSQWPQLGMTAFKRFMLQVEPNLDPERYLTLAGYNYLTGEYEPYDTAASDPDDMRFLLSSGPFDLMPDSTAAFVFAIMLANWFGIYETPDTALVLVDKYAQDYYDMYWYLYTGVAEFSPQEKLPLQLFVQPNPASHHISIVYSSCASGNVSLKLYDVLGRLQRDIFQGYQSAGTYSLNVTTRGMSQGTYFLVFETPERKQSVPIVIVR
ncbi:hypothetical protein AMJ87_11460 [candidate division WOR_3 bacterium SM23_60]|uniref:Secretion system C-terminal sorting domain-containing protein n=1 Tax=candidate division WOR_3 bacterium SM23_60 TaxID=1703780 RepID=A0A0S8GAS1_UNCW3|nr:MAG: hypothetical protein AMJ87_11460 [candidate division WOR_3 bacterium SM23_60]